MSKKTIFVSCLLLASAAFSFEIPNALEYAKARANANGLTFSAINVSDDVEILKYNAGLCEVGNEEACAEAGKALLFDAQTSRFNKNISREDYSRGMSFIAKGCNYGDAFSCNIGGNAIAYFEIPAAISFDEARAIANRAIPYFEKGCDLEDFESCMSAYGLHNYYTPDRAKMREYHIRGCELIDKINAGEFVPYRMTYFPSHSVFCAPVVREGVEKFYRSTTTLDGKTTTPQADQEELSEEDIAELQEKMDKTFEKYLKK